MGYYGEISRGYDALHFEEQAEKARIIIANCSGLRGLLLDIGAGIETERDYARKQADLHQTNLQKWAS